MNKSSVVSAIIVVCLSSLLVYFGLQNATLNEENSGLNAELARERESRLVLSQKYQNDTALLQQKLDLLNSSLQSSMSENDELKSQIESLESEITGLQLEVNASEQRYENLSTQYSELSAHFAKLQNDYLGVLGVKNGTYVAYYDDVAVLNYSWSFWMDGLTRRHTAVMSVYNFKAGCSIDVKIYSPTAGTAKTFTYDIPFGYKVFVETWDTGWSDAYYPNIIIQAVRR